MKLVLQRFRGKQSGSHCALILDKKALNLPASLLSTHTPNLVPVSVVHGKSDGATVFVSAAIRSDELICVEIIRRPLRSSALRYLCGTLVCVPVVNIFGVVNHSVCLPTGAI